MRRNKTFYLDEKAIGQLETLSVADNRKESRELEVIISAYCSAKTTRPKIEQIAASIKKWTDRPDQGPIRLLWNRAGQPTRRVFRDVIRDLALDYKWHFHYTRGNEIEGTYWVGDQK